MFAKKYAFKLLEKFSFPPYVYGEKILRGIDFMNFLVSFSQNKLIHKLVLAELECLIQQSYSTMMNKLHCFDCLTYIII